MPPLLDDDDEASGTFWASSQITPSSKRAREPSPELGNPEHPHAACVLDQPSVQYFGLRTPVTDPRPSKKACISSSSEKASRLEMGSAESFPTTNASNIDEWLRKMGKPGQGFVVIRIPKSRRNPPPPTSMTSEISHPPASDTMTSGSRGGTTEEYEDGDDTIDDMHIYEDDNEDDDVDGSDTIQVGDEDVNEQVNGSGMQDSAMSEEDDNIICLGNQDIMMSIENHEALRSSITTQLGSCSKGCSTSGIAIRWASASLVRAQEVGEQEGDGIEDQDAMMRTPGEREAFDQMLPFLLQGDSEQRIGRTFETIPWNMTYTSGQRDTESRVSASPSPSPSAPFLDNLLSTSVPRLLHVLEAAQSGASLDLSAGLVAELKGLEGDPELIFQAVAYLFSMLPEGVIDQHTEAREYRTQPGSSNVPRTLPPAVPTKSQRSYRWVEMRLNRFTHGELIDIGQCTFNMITEIGIKSLVRGVQPMHASMLDSTSEGHTSRLVSLIANYSTTTEVGYMVGIKKVAFCIAFFIMSGNSPNRWLLNAAHRAKHASRLPSVPQEDIDLLWRRANEESSGIGKRYVTKTAFAKTYDRLRYCGSWYVWLASQVGAGSLLYLHQMFSPDEVHNAPKGKDQGGGSKLLRRRLKDDYKLGTIARQYGATKTMNDVMWAMMEEFDGIARPSQHEAFPGFTW
ncbi:hypothetical protein BDV96DRAFT_579768 [Lophiotrema nucula]|uniref:Uncharacterized protein n=1 Tax=Lophiotrema nucula TaxID=690887 RepID=A0A6A5Z0Y9_9PLEO|nr:hypothetical protein BDV96DRAFT_579768 [Lophiotrema nucula]